MKELDRTVFHLQTARLLGSISQGIAIVDLALYLKELRWSANEIGGVLSGAAIVGTVLILFVGIMSDRYGRKIFLVTYESIVALATLLSMNSLAVRLTSAIGPTMSGYFLEMGMFTVPFIISGSLQLISNLMYGRFFRDFDLPSELVVKSKL